MELETIVRGLIDKDEAVWRHTVERYGRLVRSVLARFDVPEARRDELFQDVWVAVGGSIGKLRDPAKLSSWLYGIAYRTALQELRRRGRDPMTHGLDVDEDPLPLPDAAEGPDSGLARLQEVALLQDAVAGLGHRCRILIEALYLEDPPLSYKEIEETCGIPMGSIGPTRSRCLEKLRGLYSEVSNPRGGPTTDRSAEAIEPAEGETR